MSKRSRKSVRNERIAELSRALILNGKAIEDGPHRKKWSKHDLRHIKPLTPTQNEFFHDFLAGKHICAHGSAGTGKTYIAIYLALNELLREDSPIDQIIIVRSAVPTRDQGFLPGTLEEKSMLYELPYQEMFADFLGRQSSYEDMKAGGRVVFCTTSFIRGLTWDHSIVIVDEGQNMNFHEINSIMTRLGVHSRMIFVGDLPQTDLRKSKLDTSGMEDYIKVVSRMPEFSVIHFTHHDIVRSDFVKNWIVACEEITST